MAVTLTSHTPAHSVTTTVAPFRAWRGSRLAVARGPMRDTINRSAGLSGVYTPSATAITTIDDYKINSDKKTQKPAQLTMKTTENSAFTYSESLFTLTLALHSER
jgi:hypothetical protein